MGSPELRSIVTFGTVLLLALLHHARGFVISGRPCVAPTAAISKGVRLGLTSPAPVQQRISHTKANCIIDEYQENPEELAEGDIVKVIAKGLKFYHIRAYKDEGYDPEGTIGEITWLKLVSRKTGGLVTANRPVLVSFTKPVKTKCHFEFGEVMKVTEDELKAYKEEVAKEKVAKAAAEAAAAAAAAAAAE